MPKIRTNRAAAKRFKITSKGKLKRSKSFTNHILNKKSSKRKLHLRTSTYVHVAEEKKMLRLLGKY